jgi:hypothetical protein
MRLKIIFAFALAFCVLFSATGSFGAQDKTLQSPTAFLPETQYAFPRVLEGTEVLHDFIIQNKGTAPLEIKKVRTG